MALRLYMDQYVPRVITIQLRLRGVDVLTAFEDGTTTLFKTCGGLKRSYYKLLMVTSPPSMTFNTTRLPYNNAMPISAPPSACSTSTSRTWLCQSTVLVMPKHRTKVHVQHDDTSVS